MERRGSPRIKIFRQVAVSGPGRPLNAACSLYTIDIGYHGCQLLAPVPLKIGDLVELSILSQRTNTVSTVAASVIWSAPISGVSPVTRWRVGLEFVLPGNHWDIQPEPHMWAIARAPQACQTPVPASR